MLNQGSVLLIKVSTKLKAKCFSIRYFSYNQTVSSHCKGQVRPETLQKRGEIRKAIRVGQKYCIMKKVILTAISILFMTLSYAQTNFKWDKNNNWLIEPKI